MPTLESEAAHSELNSSVNDGSASGSSRSALSRVIPALLLLLFVGQCLWFLRTQSLTNDEALHIVAGTEAWRFHRFERWNDHPPLVFLLSTLPVLATHGTISIGYDVRYADGISPSPEVVAWSGRIVIVALGVLLGFLVWRTARRMFSEGAANFALALYAFSPALIANFSISCNDGATALITFAVAMQLVYWRRTQSWGRAVGLGLLLGAMIDTKFSLPAMFVLTLGLVLILKPTLIAWNPKDWNWRQAIAMVAISCVFVWATFFFHMTKVDVKNGFVTVNSPNRTKATTGDTHKHFNLTAYIPAGEYIEGMGRVANHLNLGHPSYFLGQVQHGKGWKMYFPTVVALKWPPVVLALFLVAVALGVARRIKFPTDLLIFAVFPAAYFLLAIFSNVDLGERHILLIYPFALLFIASLWKYAQQKRAIFALFVVLAVGNAVDVLRYAPGYLSYFTPLVNPATSWKLLSDSNLDWGQGLIALRDYQNTHPNNTIHLDYFGTIDPKIYGIRYVQLNPTDRVTGTVVVSATNLSGQLLDDPTSYHWLLQYPATILDHSLYVFQVPPDAK
ncbi:MAG: glycosyltransferase family 39 protein [Acidobacteria bacterium]|nr:glycosyltransferase family 39 protein [Acidobacteriota bacterium]